MRSQKLWGGACEVTEAVGWGGVCEDTEAVGWGVRGHRSCGVGRVRSQAVGWGGQGHRSCGVGRGRSQKLSGEVTEAVWWGVRGHRSCGVGRGRSQKLWVGACEVTRSTGCVSLHLGRYETKTLECVSLQSGNQKMGTYCPPTSNPKLWVALAHT